MTPDEAMHEALEALGLSPSVHSAVFAIQDQIRAWEREHPGQDALLSGQCDDLFAAIGRIYFATQDGDVPPLFG